VGYDPHALTQGFTNSCRVHFHRDPVTGRVTHLTVPGFRYGVIFTRNEA
jgi:hypothetical protein